jgi:hypothetical protein
MGTSKPPRARVSGPITGSDRSFGINAISANPMTDTLLKEIGRMLRGHYTTLTEELLPEYLIEIVERFPTDPHGTPGDRRRL